MGLKECRFPVETDGYDKFIRAAHSFAEEAFNERNWNPEVQVLRDNTEDVARLIHSSISPYRRFKEMTVLYPFANTDIMTGYSLSPDLLFTIERRPFEPDVTEDDFVHYFEYKFHVGYINWSIPHAHLMLAAEMYLAGIRAENTALKSVVTGSDGSQILHLVQKTEKGKTITHTHCAGYSFSGLSDPWNADVNFSSSLRGDVVIIDKAAQDEQHNPFNFTAIAEEMAPCFLVSDKVDRFNIYREDIYRNNPRFQLIDRYSSTKKVWDSNTARHYKNGGCNYKWGYANDSNHFAIYYVK